MNVDARSPRQPSFGPTARLRLPAVAGRFYPDDPEELAATVDEALAAATPPPADRPPKAIIAPHAGYPYSGPVAATAYAAVAPRRGQIERVVLLGPAHHVAVPSLGLSGVDAWATPLGLVPIDRRGCATLIALPWVATDDRAHAPEHSLEVHLPFLQRALGDQWSLLPIIVGHATATEVADALALVWGGPETLVVVSTDLSHYHPYGEAVALDAATASAIAAGDTDIDPQQACGAYPVRGLLEAARRHGLGVELLDLRNSGDTAGPRDRVVGYGSFALR
jgi:AmmeMemoRadiSam system protein B